MVLSKRGVVALCVSICLILLFSIQCSCARDSQYKSGVSKNVKLEKAQKVLTVYLRKKKPSVLKSCSKYAEYLTELLMFEKDIRLAKNRYYKEIKIYASEFLTEYEKKMAVVNNIADKKVSKVNIINKNKNVGDVIREAKIDTLKNEILTTEVYSATKTKTAAKYSDAEAVKYARKWALGYNYPAYAFFQERDCTNFVSQCVRAGGKSFKTPSKIPKGKYKTTKYWYSKRYNSGSVTVPHYTWRVSTSFINVGDFYTHWKNRGIATKSYSTKKKLQKGVHYGDVVQLKNGEGKWFHSIIITAGKKGDWKYCAHTTNRKDHPISKMSGGVAYRALEF